MGELDSNIEFLEERRRARAKAAFDKLLYRLSVDSTRNFAVSRYLGEIDVATQLMNKILLSRAIREIKDKEGRVVVQYEHQGHGARFVTSRFDLTDIQDSDNQGKKLILIVVAVNLDSHLCASDRMDFGVDDFYLTANVLVGVQGFLEQAQKEGSLDQIISKTQVAIS